MYMYIIRIVNKDINLYLYNRIKSDKIHLIKNSRNNKTVLILHDENEMTLFGDKLARIAQRGDILLLSGALGAGKSVFARAFLRSFCANPTMEVPSPTYTLVQPYPSPRCTVYHFDLWRLNGANDLDELGWDEAQEGIILVEWPERLENLSLPHALHITLSILSNGCRAAHLKGWENRLPHAMIGSFLS